MTYDLHLSTESTTNIAKAFDYGLQMLSNDCPNRPTSRDIAVLITDGVANKDTDKTDMYVSRQINGVHLSDIWNNTAYDWDVSSKSLDCFDLIFARSR